ncbi:hypothetical protein ACQPYK_00495 [Streptosporangium sp. CA-135522]|uniref:hypothetical protein n=1 Tax=Streptosporangium sp. CA-135522 TaxID=3240072 RepID=UPI003D8EB63E
MTLSPLDDYPVHQSPDVMRHVATSDRNFYDRYYFNCHAGSDELMLIVGVGQYPNLGVTDAFACVRHRNLHRVVRASRELGDDRMNTRIGPFRVEVIEGLRRLRIVLEPNEHGLSYDLTWDATIPATLEPRHFVRWQERVMFDSSRLAQTGRWTGHIMIGDERVEVTPDRWQGTRDRSWGIRPVGEPEPPGIQARNAGTFYWLYAPVQFDDHAILCIVQEDEKGRRVLEEAVRVWGFGSPREGEEEYLGRPEYRPEYVAGTRDVREATISFCPPGGKPFDLRCTPILPVHLMVGTGYGLEPDWKHGMYQGPGPVVQGVTHTLPQDAARMWGLVDAVGRFEYDGHVGYGLYEYWALGPHPSFPDA